MKEIQEIGFNPGSGRSPGGGNSNPLQYSCLENSMDRGAWWATVLEVKKSQTQLSTCFKTHFNLKDLELKKKKRQNKSTQKW